MIYPADFEVKIGFAPLRLLLKEKCLSRKGRDEVDAMNFSTNFRQVSTALQLTSEMLGLLTSGLQPPCDNLNDIAPSLSSLKADGSFISADQLLLLKGFLITLQHLRDFFYNLSDNTEKCKCPGLVGEFGDMLTFPHITSAIDNAIDKFGHVKDNASPRLAEIRKEIASLNSSMAGMVRRFISRAAAEGIVEADASPSMRDGRLVVPVTAMNKRKVNGIVHDQSATGKTVYIEPAEVVEAGNRLREFELDERREIVLILMGIASVIRPHIEEIMQSVDSLAKFDFIRAKALLAIDLDAQMPHLSKKPLVEWYGAVHPVLFLSLRQQHRETVPLNIRLDNTTRFVVISGPNAGGKSVCLKTVGCVQYMAQCGLLPTLRDNSHIGMFSKIFVDIGDEQSIENDLSTYSSHLRNMKFFLRSADAATLILADEMGTGTEPQIGGALAQAILSKLAESKCFGIVTTHYQNLKTFAEETPGFINAAMLYDRQHLRPLFKLSIGNPGSSFALEIARNTGLPQEIIADAREIVGTDYVNMDKYLLDIARDRKYVAEKRQAIKKHEARLESLVEAADKRADDLRTKRSEILNQAREEARKVLEGANARIERTILEIRKTEADKARTKELRKQLEDYKKSLDQTQTDVEPEILRHRKKHRNKEKTKTSSVDHSLTIKEGSTVKMSDGASVGTVRSLEGKKAEVAFGNMRLWVDLSKLVAADPPKSTPSTQVSSFGRSTEEANRKRQLQFNTEIDLRGMRVDEALQAVAYFIDDAVQFNAGRVRILHGTGTGALKEAIRAYLMSVPGIKSFKDEDVRFGGAGITVVNLE